MRILIIKSDQNLKNGYLSRNVVSLLRDRYFDLSFVQCLVHFFFTFLSLSILSGLFFHVLTRSYVLSYIPSNIEEVSKSALSKKRYPLKRLI